MRPRLASNDTAQDHRYDATGLDDANLMGRVNQRGSDADERWTACLAAKGDLDRGKRFQYSSQRDSQRVAGFEIQIIRPPIVGQPQRQDSHPDKVAAMDPFEAIRKNCAHAQ